MISRTRVRRRQKPEVRSGLCLVHLAHVQASVSSQIPPSKPGAFLAILVHALHGLPACFHPGLYLRVADFHPQHALRRIAHHNVPVPYDPKHGVRVRCFG